jgi:hypothetical protein
MFNPKKKKTMKTSISKIGMVLLLALSIGFPACEEEENNGSNGTPQDTTFKYLYAYVAEDDQGNPIGALPEGTANDFEDHFNGNNNLASSGLSLTFEGMPGAIIPAAGEAGNGAAPGDPWFDKVTYQGAFKPGGPNWASWTLTFGMEDYSNGTYAYAPTDTLTVSGNITSDTTWSNATLIKLDGFIFVEEGATLTIEAGTMIQGLPGQKENASALIITRGGKIVAEGTAEKPIVFTKEGDNYMGTATAITENGQWGGLIVLGSAPNNNPTDDRRIEGIPEGYPSEYGGSDPASNSGILKYISIRHGGTDIGAGNEINGLSFGSVGNGTTVDHIEVIANKDDGFEWFGGTVNTKHLLAVYCGDDSYDYDEGFRGKGQFWATIQAEGTGGRLGEHDSGGPGEGETPRSKPVIYNATYVGNGGDLITFRDDAGGVYANSIFFNTDGGIEVEYREDKHNSWDQFSEGELVIKNNLFQNVAE